MKLNDVRALFERTSCSEWHMIGAPTFHMVIGTIGTSAGQELSVNYHTDAAVCRDDVALTLGWGLDHPSDSTFSPDYLEQFPLQKSIRRTCIDVFWNGGVIDRIGLDILENSYLPTPKPHYKEGRSATPVERYTVQAYEVALARLVHGPEKLYDDFDKTLAEAGFEVVDTTD